jgi:hypothetical protein
LGKQGRERLGRGGDQLVVDASPSGDGQLLQPRPAPAEEVVGHRRRGRGRCRRRPPRRPGPSQRGVEAAQQRVVDRAEQRRTPAGQRRQLGVGDRAGGELVDRLAHRLAERRGRHRAGQGGERPGGPLAEAGEAVDQAVVEAGHQLEGLLDPRRSAVGELGELHPEHQPATPVAGNQCSSAMGSVVSGSSR